MNDNTRVNTLLEAVSLGEEGLRRYADEYGRWLAGIAEWDKETTRDYAFGQMETLNVSEEVKERYADALFSAYEKGIHERG